MEGGGTFRLSFILLSALSLVQQEVAAEEQIVLASEALTSYMKAYLNHYRSQKEGLETENEGEEELRSKDGKKEDYDEGFLDYYYDIGTSEETMPNVNWTMLKPRHPLVKPWRPNAPLPHRIMGQIIENNLLDNNLEEEFPGFKRGFRPSLAGQCGQPGPSQQIVGGEEATAHSFPWMAALFVDGKYFCGGSLISEEWVLTAAHCVDGEATEVRVLLGAHNIRIGSEAGRTERTTMMFFTHPEYDASLLQNDIALVHLGDPVEFSNSIRPVCLPTHSDAGDSLAGLEVLASGWGRPKDNATGISPVLREVSVTTIDNLTCASQYPTVVTKKILCISGLNGRSTCKGDSGGPLHLINQGVFTQVGVTSFGSVFGCEVNMHAGFTRTAAYLQWIETQTGIMVEPRPDILLNYLSYQTTIRQTW